MRNITKNITYFFISILVILSINTINAFNTGQAQIGNLFSNINNLNIKEERKNIEKAISLVNEKNNTKKTILKAEILDAYLKYEEKKYEESIGILSESIFNIENKNMYNEIFFEVYKLKYLNYTFLNEGKNTKLNFEKLIDLSINKEKYLVNIIDLFSNTFGNLLDLENGTNIAASLVDKLIVISSRIDNHEKNIELYKNAGTIYMVKNQLDISLEAQIKALNIAVESLEQEQINTILIDISTNYILQESYEEAIQIIKYCTENTELDINTEIDLLGYLSLAYIETGKYYEAEKISKLLEDQIEKLDGDLKFANKLWAYVGYADIYNHLSMYDKSKEYLEKATKLYEKYEDISFLGTDVSILTEYGDLYYNLGEYEKALDNHIQAYNILSLKNSENGLTKILEAISNDYYKLGQLELSNKILKEIKNMYDYEIKDINDKQIENIYKSIMLQEKNKQIKNISQGKKILIELVLILGVFLIIAYINNKLIKNKKDKIKLINDELMEENVKDILTGIYNRKGLKKYLETIKLDDNISSNYSFFMIDIDCFKLYNDNYGHLKGDEILVNVSRVIQNICKENGSFLARYGGEEFILILKYSDEIEIHNLAYQIYKNIELANIEHNYSKASNVITLSTGICYGEIDDKDFIEAINQADKALYKSKENGRNRYTISKFKS